MCGDIRQVFLIWSTSGRTVPIACILHVVVDNYRIMTSHISTSLLPAMRALWLSILGSEIVYCWHTPNFRGHYIFGWLVRNILETDSVRPKTTELESKSGEDARLPECANWSAQNHRRRTKGSPPDLCCKGSHAKDNDSFSAALVTTWADMWN